MSSTHAGGRLSKSNGIAVVDGANVAWEETTVDGAPKVSNLVTMRQELERAGYDPIVVVEASLRYEVDDADQLEGLLDAGKLSQAPAGTDADRFVLAIAEENDAMVISNDRFDPYRESHPWIDERRVPFMVVRGHVYLTLEAQAR